ncbi:MAG: DUF2911 domain-containing protein [Bacteroidota bacterium]
MKKLLTMSLICFSAGVISQEKINIGTPPPSPEASFTQQLGTSEIKVNYSRPMARGRKIFGGLVPFDSLWRTGASGCTTVEFTQEMIMGNKSINAGKYALFTIPTENEWTIVLNTDTALHGAFGYDSKKDVHRFKIPAGKSEKFYEAFTIESNEITNKGGGFLTLAWENTIVQIPVKSPADEKIMAEINRRLIANKEENAELQYQAANYYYATGRDYKQAVLWLNEAEKTDSENFYYPNLRQKILGDLRDYKNGIEAAKKALILGEKKKMTNAIPALKKRIAEWENQLKNK